MLALVTGAGGFLGQYIAEQLVANYAQVRNLSRKRYPCLDELGVETVQCDLRDKEAVKRACQGVDVVFHNAGVAGIWGPREHFFGINTEGTENIIAGCREHGIPRLIYTSSPSVTFDGKDQVNIDESAPYPSQWLCHYPHSKALAEQAVLAAHEPGKLHTCALRPHLIWGPRDQHLIPRLLTRARQGKLRQVGDGQNLVDMVYVENAATAHLQAAEALVGPAPAGGKAYFITQGEPVNCWEWINDILESAGIPRVEKRISRKMAWLAGSILETAYQVTGKQTEPRMTRFLAAQLATHHYFNIDAARQDLGYSPAISTEEGMRRLAESLQS